MTKPVFECVPSRFCADEWVVEAIDHEAEGVIYAAAFSGPGAKERAEEYADWKNRPSRSMGVAADDRASIDGDSFACVGY